MAEDFIMSNIHEAAFFIPLCFALDFTASASGERTKAFVISETEPNIDSLAPDNRPNINEVTGASMPLFEERSAKLLPASVKPTAKPPPTVLDKFTIASLTIFFSS